VYWCAVWWVQSSPHVLVVWRPDLHTYTAHITRKVDGSAPVTAKMNNVDLPKVVVQGLGKAIQLWQEDVHVSRSTTPLCLVFCEQLPGCLLPTNAPGLRHHYRRCMLPPMSPVVQRKLK
jgi:hypothetical protein